jgi:hypothetical protein
VWRFKVVPFSYPESCGEERERLRERYRRENEDRSKLGIEKRTTKGRMISARKNRISIIPIRENLPAKKLR